MNIFSVSLRGVRPLGFLSVLASLFAFAACASPEASPETSPDTARGNAPVHATSAPEPDPTPLPAVPDSVPPVSSAPLYPATVEYRAPDFALRTEDGGTFRLSEARGKVVLLNFWATWCPPCRQEIPGFVSLQQDLGEDGLVIAGVALDEEGWDVVRPFAAEMAVNYPVMVDDGTATAPYGPVAALPTSFLIDRKGNIRYYAPGMLVEEALRPVLVELLEEGE